jgi:hypothetical protein
VGSTSLPLPTPPSVRSHHPAYLTASPEESPPARGRRRKIESLKSLFKSLLGSTKNWPESLADNSTSAGPHHPPTGSLPRPGNSPARTFARCNQLRLAFFFQGTLRWKPMRSLRRRLPNSSVSNLRS